MSKLRDFINGIIRPDWTYKRWLEQQESNDTEFDSEYIVPMSSADWIRFSKEFVSSINNSKVDPKTGMSHKEFLDYLATSYYPNKEFEDDDDLLIY